MKSLKSAYNLLLSATIVITIGACSGTTEPQGALRASLDVGAMRAVTAADEPFQPAATALAPATIMVRGRFTLPTSCYELRSDVSVEAGNVITLAVIAWADLPPASGCSEVMMLRDYTAAVRGVSPGRYALRVVHGVAHLSNTGDVVLEQQVVVP